MLAPYAGQSVNDVSPRNIQADLHFCANAPGSTFVSEIGEDYHDPLQWTTVTKCFHDLRGREDEHTIATSGFQLIEYPHEDEEITGELDIRDAYLQRVAEVVKTSLFAERVIGYDCQLRHLKGGPLRVAHADIGVAGGLQWRLKKFLGKEEAEKLLNRYRIMAMTAWRPLRTVDRDPLALMDARTLRSDDLVVYRLRQPGAAVDEWDSVNCFLADEPERKWYYLHKQTPQEIWLFKNQDSQEESCPFCGPHASFVDPEYADRDERRSVEARLFVLFPRHRLFDNVR